MVTQEYRLWPSTAWRWRKCPGSAYVGDLELDSPVATEEMERGKELHDSASLLLRGIKLRMEDYLHITKKDVRKIVRPYVKYIKSFELEEIRVEKYVEIDLPPYAIRGRCDAVGWNRGAKTFHVFDLKTGEYNVDAHTITQMKLYAIGFWKDVNHYCKNLKHVNLHIFQPTENNVVREKFKMSELMDFSVTISEAIIEAKTSRRLNPSKSRCKFCDRNQSCESARG